MSTKADPNAVYQNRLELHQRDLSGWESKHRLLAQLRLGVFVLGLLMLWLSSSLEWFSLYWLLVPLSSFVGLVIYHDVIQKRRTACQRLVREYEKGLRRLRHEWQKQGQSGAGFMDANHLFAADLDLFGDGSLFERLCTCQTSLGEHTLAEWLKTPVKPATAIARQAAVRELQPQLDFREQWTVLAGQVDACIHVQNLYAWVSGSGWTQTQWLRVGMEACILLSVIAMAGCSADWWSWTILPWILLIQASYAFQLSRTSRPILAQVESMQRELSVLTHLFRAMGKLDCDSPLLRELKRQIQTDADAAQQIELLSYYVDRLAWRNNAMFAPLALVLLWGTRHAFVIDAWRRQNASHLPNWLHRLGEFDALLALATYGYENPQDVMPEWELNGPLYDGKELKHPLLSIDQCVSNDVTLDTDHQLLIISGSNMSGKSTLLRTVGLNAVLAWTGAPVRAKSLRLSYFHIGATLRIQDSLQAGQSRFFAEIVRLSQILTLARNEPILFLLDELLHGTNSHDRRLGAAGLLRGLIELGSMGLATTHDLALTDLVNEIPHSLNAHFADRWDGGSLEFDYHMRPGIVQHSNALALMRSVGLNV